MTYLKIVGEALRNISRSYLITAGLLVIFTAAWEIFLVPVALRIPENFSYTAKVISVDNFYDEAVGDFKGEQYSKTEYRFDVLSRNGRLLNIRNIFDVQSFDGERIFHVEPVYAMDQYSRQLVGGDSASEQREYILGPRGLKPGEGFTFRHVSSAVPAEMAYEGEESLYGLSVYKYKKVNNAAVDQTEFMHFLPNVPEARGVALASDLYLWIEPFSGYLVKVEDFSTDYYYFDIKTGERIAPYNQFLNTFSEETVQQHADIAMAQKRLVLAVQYGVPGLLLTLAVLALLIGLRGVLPSAVRVFLSAYRWAAFVAAISLIATTVAYYFTLSLYTNDRAAHFSIQATEIAEVIDRRMEKYVTMLLGARGLFDASDQVDRDEWRLYVESLDLPNNFPGVQGVGFVKMMSPAEARRTTEAIRKEGFSNFSIFPEGERDRYGAIVYLEPLRGQNLRAFGFDMYSEKVRRATMGRARDTGVATMSGMVTLVQEDGKNPQPGFLIYVPLYTGGVATSSSATSRGVLYGYAYSPFRTYDLMASVLTGRPDDVRVRIYDGLRISPERLMYDSSAGEPVEEGETVRYREVRTLTVAEHPWTLEFTNTKDYAVPLVERLMPALVLIFGILVGGLCVLLVYVAIRSKVFAVEYARKTTKDLRESLGALEETKDAMLNVLEDVQEERAKVELVSNKLTLATESAGIGVWEWDVVKNVLTWDDQMYAIYGIKREDFGGAYDAWKNGLHPDDRKAGDDAIQAALNGEKEFSPQFRVVWPSGEVRYVQAYAIVERDSAGKPLKMTGVNWDITREKEIDKEKTEFVSLASHQLKTPVGAVKWDAEMLLSGDYGDLQPKQKEVVEEIYGLNQRMTDLVNSFLNISRIELGTFVIEPEPVNYAEVAEDVLVELKERIAAKGHVITKEFQPNMPVTLADAHLLRIVFQNLLSNAIKYTPDKGKVGVSIGVQGETIAIAVSNNGLPIPAADQSRIFTKMFRASGAQDMDPDGNGLGLYLLKSIVESAGGKVWFESAIGQDTVFRVTFPMPGMRKKSGSKKLD